MKTFSIFVLALLAGFRAAAQFSVELAMNQDQFLPNEAVRIAVKITNQSGQTVHLGADPSWLTFGVEATDNFIVIKNADVPVVEPFDLESSQMAIKRVDLQPYFILGKPGRYKVTATVRIKEWGLAIPSAPATFDVINGAELWSQAFGVTAVSNTAPEARRYALLKANYLREQLRLYLQVSSGDGGHVFKVAALGPLVSFGSPEAQVDRNSQLHVLWQTGAQSFSYAIANPDGSLVSRDIYDNFGNSRPRLGVNTNGEVMVIGGVRRTRAPELPAILERPPVLEKPPVP